MPTAISFWSVTEFDPCWAEEASAGSVDPSEAEGFNRMRDIVQSETTLRKEIADLQATNQDLKEGVQDLHQAVAP